MIRLSKTFKSRSRWWPCLLSHAENWSERMETLWRKEKQWRAWRVLPPWPWFSHAWVPSIHLSFKTIHLGLLSSVSKRLLSNTIKELGGESKKHTVTEEGVNQQCQGISYRPKTVWWICQLRWSPSWEQFSRAELEPQWVSVSSRVNRKLRRGRGKQTSSEELEGQRKEKLWRMVTAGLGLGRVLLKSKNLVLKIDFH